MKLNWTPVKQAIKDAPKGEVTKLPYLEGHVAMYCKNQPDWSPIIKYARLSFFGGNKNRPYWVDGKNCGPVENAAWEVKFFIKSEDLHPNNGE